MSYKKVKGKGDKYLMRALAAINPDLSTSGVKNPQNSLCPKLNIVLALSIKSSRHFSWKNNLCFSRGISRFSFKLPWNLMVLSAGCVHNCVHNLSCSDSCSVSIRPTGEKTEQLQIIQENGGNTNCLFLLSSSDCILLDDNLTNWCYSSMSDLT